MDYFIYIFMLEHTMKIIAKMIKHGRDIPD